MRIECELESEADRQHIFDRRFVVLRDIFATPKGDFVAILDRKINRMWFVSEHSADGLCDLLNGLNPIETEAF